MKPQYLFASILACSSLTVGAAYAAENGNIAYSPGASQFYGGGIPPIKGVFFLSQTGYRHAPDLKDENGDDVPVDFDLKSISETLRFLYVPGIKVGGLDLWGQLVIPIVRVDLELPFVGSADATSVADISASLGVVKHFDQKNTLAFGVDVVMPTGAYDEDETVNIGLNYWSFQPVLAYKYFDRAGPELSLAARGVFNTENEDTNFTTGNQFVLDYAAGWNFNQIKVGATGYYLQQFTDDEENGETLEDNRRQGFAIGPSLTYSFNPGMHVGVVWQKELYVENSSQGNFFGLNFATKF